MKFERSCVFLLLFIIVFGFSAHAIAGDKTGKSDDDEPIALTFFHWDDFMFQNMPGSRFYPFVIENYAPDATYMTESNNGFALIDNPKVYFEGDSYVNFNWFYNGLNINSYLNEGAPGVMLPFSAISSYRLQGENPSSIDYGMDFISRPSQRDGSRMMVSGVLPNAGGMFMKFMIQPSHPTERADFLYNERRKISRNFFVDYSYSKHFKPSNAYFDASFTYFDIARQFNDFNTFDETFKEDGRLFLFNTRYIKKLKNGLYEVFGVFNYLDRSHLGAEMGDLPQETDENKRTSLLAGFRWKTKSFDLRLSAMLEREERHPVEMNFTKDLIDNDGDNLLPYGSTDRRLGTFTATTFNLSFRAPNTSWGGDKMRLTGYVDARYSIIHGKETPHEFNAITMDGNPYRVVKWDGGMYWCHHEHEYNGGAADYTNTNLHARGGAKLEYEISKDISLLGNVFVNYDRLAFDFKANNISKLSVGFDAGIHLFKNKRTNLLFAFGMMPYDLRSNVNFFLESYRPWGNIYQWDDPNGDGVFQPGEEGIVSSATGGAAHHVDEDLEMPMKQRALLYFTMPISRNYTFNLKGIYKHISNRLRVAMNTDYNGFYETHADQELFFFNTLDVWRPYYYLTNGGYSKDPFYAALLLNVTGRKANKWFFSFSFLAHMGMADTAFGNGPGSNDFGILDESMGDPNSWLNGYGRVDGERGFVAKSYFGFYLNRDLFLGVSLKYRDGNAFAFYNRTYAHNRWVITYQTIKAEDQKGKKGGPREDYVADVSVQLKYRFTLFDREAFVALSVFNLLDFGAELSEYVYSGGTRDSVELQIPRSIRLTFGWRF